MEMHPFREQRAREHAQLMLTGQSIYAYLKKKKDCLGNFKQVTCSSDKCLTQDDKLAAAYNKIAEKKCGRETV